MTVCTRPWHEVLAELFPNGKGGIDAGAMLDESARQAESCRNQPLIMSPEMCAEYERLVAEIQAAHAKTMPPDDPADGCLGGES